MDKSNAIKNKRHLSVVALLLLTILSFTMVALTVHPSVSALPNIVIPVSYNNHAAPLTGNTTLLPTPAAADNRTLGGLTVSDANRVWHTQTQVDIFNPHDPRVKSDGSGQALHVIAPGTANDYVFCIKNNERYWYDYVVKIKAGENSPLDLPVEVQIFAPDGSALTGDGWVPIREIGEITHAYQLKANRSTQYRINWRWEFEAGRDGYDTLLGNTAVEEEIACYMNIEVVAQYELDEKGNPKTGDDTNLTIYWIILGVSAGTVLLLVLLWRRRPKEDKDHRKKANKTPRDI